MLLNTILTTALGLCSLAAAAPSSSGRPCGFKIAPCPSGTECIPNDDTCTNLNRCAGTCVAKPPKIEYQSCGGKRATPPPPCKTGTECRDDPRTWNGNCGLACDKPGICISVNQPTCGGFIGASCPTGMECYDMLEDDCDPNEGGADCLGICL